MSLTWREPDPSPVQEVSPTSVNALLACPRRFASSRDAEMKKWSRPSPATALGLVAHKLTEICSTEAVVPAGQEPAAWLTDTWDGLVAEQQHKIQAAWPGRDVPPPHLWRGYNVTKVRLLRRLRPSLRPVSEASASASDAQGIADDSGAGTPAATSASLPPHPWVELTLRDADRRLAGTPDRVERRAGENVVVDLKSGVDQGDITVTQRRQLLLYAHLVSAAGEALPTRAVVTDARGHESSFDVTTDEVESVLESVERALASYEGGDLSPRPSADACRWCPFRVECPAYWETHQEAWGYRAGVCGQVTQVSGGGEVTVDVAAPDAMAGTTVRLMLAGGEKPEQGQQIVAVDIDPAGTDAYRARWNSRVRLG